MKYSGLFYLTLYQKMYIRRKFKFDDFEERVVVGAGTVRIQAPTLAQCMHHRVLLSPSALSLAPFCSNDN